MDEMDLGADDNHGPDFVQIEKSNQLIAESAINVNKDHTLLNTFNETQTLRNVRDRATVHIEKKSFTYISTLLTVEKQALLLNLFSKFNLKFTNTANNQHPFAAALRIIEHHVAYEKIGYDVDFPYRQPYFTDIGGNFSNGIIQNLHGVHYCSPTLNEIDANRKTNRLTTIACFKGRSCSFTLNQNRNMKLLENPNVNNDFVCFDKVQNCNVKTKYGIAIHSLYDIKPRELGDAMDRKGMVSVVATLMFDPKIVMCEQGTLEELSCKWEIFSSGCLNKTRKIRFGFVNDNSLVYEHELSTYLSWFLITSFWSSAGNLFVIEIVENFYGVYVLRINRVEVVKTCVYSPISARRWIGEKEMCILRWQISYVGSVNPYSDSKINSEFSRFCVENSIEHKFTNSLDFDEIMGDMKSNSIGSKFHEISFLVNREVINQVLCFILGAADKKFTQAECYNYARSKLYAVIVGKEVIMNGENIDPRVIFLISQILYVYAWQLKYEHGMNMQQYMQQVNNNRVLASGNLFKKIFHWNPESSLARTVCGPWRKANKVVYNLKHDKKVNLKNMIEVLPAYVDVGSELLAKNSQIFQFLFPFLREQTPQVMLPVAGILRPDSEVMKDIVDNISPKNRKFNSDVNNYIEKPNIAFTPYENFLSLDLVNIYSKHLAEGNKNIVKKKFRSMSNKILIEYVDTNIVNSLVEYLMVKLVITNFVFLFKQGFILLELEINRSGMNRICKGKFIEHRKHIQNMLIHENIPSNIVRMLDVGSGFSIDPLPGISYIKTLKTRDVVSSVPERVGVPSKAYAKLMEIDSLYNYLFCKILPGSTVVDICSGPGSFSEYIVNRNSPRFNSTELSASIISCSYKNNGAMTDRYECKNRIRFEELCDSFDIREEEDVESFINFVNKSSTKQGVELVVADGGISGDFPDQEKRSISLFSNEIRSALSVLKKGGRFLLKLYIGETYETVQLIGILSKFFKECKLIKPPSSNLANGEVYIACLDYLCDAYSTEIVLSSLTERCYIGLENYLNWFNLNRLLYLQNAELKPPSAPPPVASDSDSPPAYNKIVSVNVQRVTPFGEPVFTAAPPLQSTGLPVVPPRRKKLLQTTDLKTRVIATNTPPQKPPRLSLLNPVRSEKSIVTIDSSSGRPILSSEENSQIISRDGFDEVLPVRHHSFPEKFYDRNVIKRSRSTSDLDNKLPKNESDFSKSLDSLKLKMTEKFLETFYVGQGSEIELSNSDDSVITVLDSYNSVNVCEVQSSLDECNSDEEYLDADCVIEKEGSILETDLDECISENYPTDAEHQEFIEILPVTYMKIITLETDNQQKSVFNSPVNIPDLRTLETRPDGNCLFHALTLGSVPVESVKLKLLSELDNSDYYGKLSLDNREAVRSILEAEREWGNSDIISIFAEVTKCCVIELVEGSTELILHGNYNYGYYKYVYYSNNHFSACVPVDSMYLCKCLEESIMHCEIYRRYFDELPIINNPFIRMKDIVSGMNVVLHVSALECMNELKKIYVKCVRHLSNVKNFVLVSFTNLENNVSPKLMMDNLYNHWSVCENCKSGSTPSYWCHLVEVPTVQISCSRYPLSVVHEHAEFCDLVIDFVEDAVAFKGVTLHTIVMGNKITVSLPTMEIEESFFKKIVGTTLEPYLSPNHINTVFVKGELSELKIKAINVIIPVIHSIYHHSIIVDEKSGRDFSFNINLSNTKGGIMHNAAAEILAAYRCTYNAVMRRGEELHNKYKSSINNNVKASFSDTSIGVFGVSSNTWLIRPTAKLYNWAYGVNVVQGNPILFKMEEFYKGGESRNLFIERVKSMNVSWLFVWKATEVLLEPFLHERIKNVPIFVNQLENIDVEVVKGVPGAGKTHYILGRHKFSLDTNEIILTATRNAAIDLRKRIKEKNPKTEISEQLLKRKYTTVESVLMNSDRYESVETIYFDEAFLKHLGTCVWAAILVKAKKIILVGDEAQIPYSDRQGLKMQFHTVANIQKVIPINKQTFLNISYRVPRDIATLINTCCRTVNGKKMYPKDIQTVNPVERSISFVKIAGVSELTKVNHDRYLTFTQFEKAELIKHFGAIVSTIHEFQGQQASSIGIVRFKGVNNEVYKTPQQILTGVSRHTKECVYYTVTTDLLSEWIKLVNARPVQPALEQPTAKVRKGGGWVYNSFREKTLQEQRVNPRLKDTSMAPDFELRLFPDYCVNLNKEDQTLASLVLMNEGGGYRGHYVVAEPVPYNPPPRMTAVNSSAELDVVNVLQYCMDEIRPGASLEPSRHKMYVFEDTDLVVYCRDFELGPIQNLAIKVDTLTPVLRTPCPQKFINSQKAVLKAFNERNGAVDDMETSVFTDEFLDFTWNQFIDTYFKSGARSVLSEFKKSPLVVNVDSLTNWLNTQPPGVFEELKAADSHLLLTSISNRFSYMLKSVAKPKLDANPELEFASPQAIAFLTKLVNSIYCPLVQELKRRIQFLLKEDKILFTDMSVEILEEVLTNRMPRGKLSRVKKKFEIDFAKYDRSQKFWALSFEEKVLKSFGMSDLLVELWIKIHKISLLISRENRFKALVEYQRKSGDAMTFLGNTLWLMYMLMILIEPHRMSDSFALFGGDDSLIFFFKEYHDLEYDKLFSKSAALFNMELKIISSKSFYFCSRFLIFSQIDDRWYVIPDPLKSLIKLGRSDLVNERHVDEYRISLHDNWVNYSNLLLHSDIDVAFRDRYPCKLYTGLLLQALWCAVSDIKRFRTLYYWFDGDEERKFTVLPSLDI